MKYVASSLAAIGLSFAVAAPLHAQSVNANNLVNVSLTDTEVLNNIANDLQIQDVADIPASVQVPVGIAANVCNVAANVLANKNNPDYTGDCTAETTNDQLNRIVQKQMNTQG